MPYQVEFKDTTNINKSFHRSVLEGVYIGNIFNLKINDYPVYKTIKNMFKYIFAKNVLDTLTESQVRIVDDYTIIGNKLIKYYQIQVPYLLNTTDDYQTQKYNQFTEFIENLNVYKSIDIFYYDRLELISDYDFYFSQLDQKINSQNNLSDINGRLLTKQLRTDMPNLIQEMMYKYQPRTREAFVIISTNLNGNTLEVLDKTKTELDTKVFKLLTGLKTLNIDYIQVCGKHKQWLFDNFVSNITNY